MSLRFFYPTDANDQLPKLRKGVGAIVNIFNEISSHVLNTENVDYITRSNLIMELSKNKKSASELKSYIISTFKSDILECFANAVIDDKIDIKMIIDNLNILMEAGIENKDIDADAAIASLFPDVVPQIALMFPLAKLSSSLADIIRGISEEANESSVFKQESDVNEKNLISINNEMNDLYASLEKNRNDYNNYEKDINTFESLNLKRIGLNKKFAAARIALDAESDLILSEANLNGVDKNNPDLLGELKKLETKRSDCDTEQKLLFSQLDSSMSKLTTIRNDDDKIAATKAMAILKDNISAVENQLISKKNEKDGLLKNKLMMEDRSSNINSILSSCTTFQGSQIQLNITPGNIHRQFNTNLGFIVSITQSIIGIIDSDQVQLKNIFLNNNSYVGKMSEIAEFLRSGLRANSEILTQYNNDNYVGWTELSSYKLYAYYDASSQYEKKLRAIGDMLEKIMCNYKDELFWKHDIQSVVMLKK